MAAIEGIVARCQERVEDLTFASVVDWKNSHPTGKVLGYFPVYFPAEIAHAGGMLPIAIFGGGNHIKLKQADTHMYSFMCSICKSTMELGLRGSFGFLDVFIGTPICDAARHMPALLERNVAGLTVDNLYTPGSLTPELAVPYLHREYQRLRQVLQSAIGRPISDDAVRRSIRLYNEDRRLVREIYAVRRQKPWIMPASECYLVVRAGTLMPVEEHIDLLREVLALLPGREVRPLDKIRVVYEGAFCEQPPLEFIQALEEVCYVADDDFMLGSRLITDDVPEDGDPLHNLASSYRDRSSYSSVQHDMRRLKSDGLLVKCRAANAQAVILSPAKFCEPGLDDQVHHMKRTDKEGIPSLQMEFQERMRDFDGIRVQTETFAEALLFYAN